jgi:hypothetical protein
MVLNALLEAEGKLTQSLSLYTPFSLLCNKFFKSNLFLGIAERGFAIAMLHVADQLATSSDS